MTKIRKITKQGKNKNSLEKKEARAPHKYNKYNNNKKAENNKKNKSAQNKKKFFGERRSSSANQSIYQSINLLKS